MRCLIDVISRNQYLKILSSINFEYHCMKCVQNTQRNMLQVLKNQCCLPNIYVIQLNQLIKTKPQEINIFIWRIIQSETVG
jgi:hypothetical protein